jgi:hypothetical protein
MMLLKAGRAWLASSMACASLLAAWVAVGQAVSGRWQYAWHNMMDIAVGFGGIFAVVAGVLYIPVFAALSLLLKQRFTRRMGIALGAMFAPTAYLAIAIWFRESQDPRTITGWAWYFLEHLPAFLFGSLPFVAAGAVFGLVWCARSPQRRTLGHPGRVV